MGIDKIEIVPPKGSGYPDYAISIGGQSAGIQLQPDWQTGLGKQKTISLSGYTYPLSSLSGVTSLTTLYTIPYNKNFYLIQASISNQLIPTSFPPVNYPGCVGYIIDNTVGVTLFTLGGLTDANIPTSQPIKVPGGHELNFTIVNIAKPFGSGYLMMDQFTCLSSSTVSRISVYSRVAGSVRVAIYADAAGEPAAQLGASITTAVLAGQWNTFNLPAPIALVNGTNYWLAYTTYTVGAVEAYLSARSRRYKIFNFADTLPNPAGTTFNTDNTKTDSIQVVDRLVLGNTEVGAALAGNWLAVQAWVAAATITVTRIGFWQLVGGAGVRVYLGIYGSVVLGSPPLGLTGLQTASVLPGWNIFDLITPVAVTVGNTYYLACALESSASYISGPLTGTGMYLDSPGLGGWFPLGNMPAVNPPGGVYHFSIIAFGTATGILGSNIQGNIDNEIGQMHLTEGTLVGYEI